MSTPAPDAPEAGDHDLPFSCDLIMKGGITSGVVYPAAIDELARDHRFHNIGGASAGAIAAVAAAAAEFGRQTGGGGGFHELASIPTELADTDGESGSTFLQRLFVAQPETSEYFELFWTQRSMKGGFMKRFLSVLPSLFRHSPKMPDSTAAKIGAFGLPIGAVIWLALAPAAGTIAFAALASLVGGAIYLGSRAVTGARNMVSDGHHQITNNQHGLCNGRSVGDRVGLTDWLNECVERIAGPVRREADGSRGERPQPLTYGDLRREEIGLVTLTTNISQSSSESFPFSDETWAFDPDDMSTLLPESVSGYLTERGERATESSSKEEQLRQQGLLKLPPADELPVILGARVSLSYPVVLSAVPFWRLVALQRSDAWVTEYQKVWLSDGGICSNLPVHLFDNPLPSRPTYGINLSSGASEISDDEARMAHAHQNVWRPIKAGSGGSSPIADVRSTAQLLGEVLNAMQNWSDNSMTKALGMRDRICTIRLGKGEGGMNLDMAKATIDGLVPRGRAAGENLGWMVRGDVPEHVDLHPENIEAQTQWTRHRWTRLRSTALGAGAYAAEVKAGLEKASVPQHGARASNLSYPDLGADAESLSYLPYRSGWTTSAGSNLAAAMQALTEVDFGSANSTSPPPFRRLTLSARSAPETELDE